MKAIMATYVSTQSADQTLQDMMTQYSKSSSVYPDMKKLREVLTLLSDQQKLHILQREYNGWTPLQHAAFRDHTEIIITLLTSLQSPAYRLKQQTGDEYTPLHRAAWKGHTKSVKMILDCLTAHQQIQLMSVQDWIGKTAIQYTELRGHTDTVRILREYQHRADNLMREEYSKFIINLCPPPYQSMCFYR